MDDDENKIKQIQQAEGIGNAQAQGYFARAISNVKIFNMPIDKFFDALLMTSAIVQGAGLLCCIATLSLFWGFTMFYPLCFTPLALLGFFIGIQFKNKRIQLLSLLNGFFSIIPWVPILLAGGAVRIADIFHGLRSLFGY